MIDRDRLASLNGATTARSTRRSRRWTATASYRDPGCRPLTNMALFSPHHSEADVDPHTEVFGEAVAALLG